MPIDRLHNGCYKAAPAVAGDLTVRASTRMETLLAKDGAVFKGPMTVPAADVEGLLTVAGGAMAQGPLVVAGDMKVQGPLIVAGGAKVQGPLVVAGGAELAGPLGVAGGAKVQGPLDVAGDAKVQGPLVVADTTQAGSVTAGTARFQTMSVQDLVVRNSLVSDVSGEILGRIARLREDYQDRFEDYDRRWDKCNRYAGIRDLSMYLDQKEQADFR